MERWLNELAGQGLLEKATDPVGYRCCSDAGLRSQIDMLAEIYRISPVRVIEAIYRRDTHAAQSFADAFKIKNPESHS
ncbi:hypothetical protein [Prosthecobacter sp.]|uniref:hypothetical protein n=1 Tax=Prosthecobacter sp. TaxID=1965333 RepID=UPI003784D3A7